MSLAEFDQYVAMVENARQEWMGRVDIRLGMESDYIPGMEPWLETLHRMAEFHHVLGSVHPHLEDYRDRFYTGDFAAYVATYFDHIAMAAETGLFDTIAHPDLVKRVSPDQWDPTRAMGSICPSLDRIARAGTAMELNTSGLNAECGEVYPNKPMLGEMLKRNIPVVLGADAHDPGRVAADFENALDILSSVGYTHINIFLDRQRREIPIANVRNQLQKI
tara:strand:- start:539 stop:1198 length:660 start_codon:yes stop_codon:yes gene_type:complete